METARIDIAYRPVRVAWVIESTDFESFRKVVRLSHTLWGGRFNPIVFADKPKQARELVDSFRVDMLMPVGASPDVARLAAAYPHLPTPYFSDGLFRGRGDDAHALLLDIENGLVFAREKQKTTDLIKAEFRTFMWDPADPLADMLLVQLGSYPSPQDFPIDYWEIFSTLNPTEDVIPVDEPLPSRIYDHPGIAYLPRYNLQRHFSIQSKPDLPGFFVGDVTSLDDLVAFWNLRAADNTLQFIDRAAFDRFEHLIPDFERRLLAGLAHPDQDRGHIAVWARREILDEAGQRFSGRRIILVAVDEHSWNGLNMRPPMMILGTASALGVVGDSSGRPRVSFALADKPFSGDIWFHTQHLVASLSLIGVGLLDQRYTFQPPYVPD